MKYQLLQCILKEKIMGFKEPARNGKKNEKKKCPQDAILYLKSHGVRNSGRGGSEKKKEKKHLY